MSHAGFILKPFAVLRWVNNHLFLSLSDCLFHSAYQVVVEEERPRRARGGEAEILRCYPIPVHYQNATSLNSKYYFTAEFPSGGIPTPLPFTVGDNRTYSGFWNAPLLPHKSYSVYYQAVSTANGVGVNRRLATTREVESCDTVQHHVLFLVVRNWKQN